MSRGDGSAQRGIPAVPRPQQRARPNRRGLGGRARRSGRLPRPLRPTRPTCRPNHRSSAAAATAPTRNERVPKRPAPSRPAVPIVVVPQRQPQDRGNAPGGFLAVLVKPRQLLVRHADTDAVRTLLLLRHGSHRWAQCHTRRTLSTPIQRRAVQDLELPVGQLVSDQELPQSLRGHSVGFVFPIDGSTAGTAAPIPAYASAAIPPAIAA